MPAGPLVSAPQLAAELAGPAFVDLDRDLSESAGCGWAASVPSTPYLKRAGVGTSWTYARQPSSGITTLAGSTNRLGRLAGRTMA